MHACIHAVLVILQITVQVRYQTAERPQAVCRIMSHVMCS